MKKITLLFSLLITGVFAFAQSPTDNATDPPARDAGDVISIFSGAYTDVAGSDYNPNWGQAGFGTANTAFDPGTGNLVLGYPNFNYQGNQFGSAQNISAMEFLHVDIWIEGSFNPNVFVISSGAEIAHPITNTGANTWISVDIPIAGITADTSNAIQFKFDGGNGTTDAIYVDNLYFWKNPTTTMTDATLSDLQVNGVTVAGFSPATETYTYEVAPGDPVPTVSATTTQAGASEVITQAGAVPGDATVVVTAEDGTTMKTYTVSFTPDPTPTTAAPTPPSFNAPNVISIYSDAFPDVTSNFDAGWCGGSSVEEVMIAGNSTMKYLANACQGIDFAGDRRDATSFNRLHIDFYTTETNLVGKVFNLKLVDFGAGTGTAELANVEINLNDASSPAITTGTWISVDAVVDLSGFTGLAQAAITSNLNGTVWYDNYYLYVDGTASTEDRNFFESKVYPNPASEQWTISTPNNTIKTIEVFNVLGKRVVSRNNINSDVANISVESLASGIYLAKISTDQGTKTVKLIRE